VVTQVLYHICRSQGEDQGCDNVLPSQDFHTLQTVLVDEYGAMVKCWYAGESQGSIEKLWLYCYFSS
jgi:hypothetical protein